MTWESVKLPNFPVAPFGTLLLVVALGAFSFLEGSPSPSLESRCEAEGGEWLNDSTLPTCIMPTGEWLTFDDVLGKFVPPGELLAETAPNGDVLHSDEPPVIQTVSTSDESCELSPESYAVEGVYGSRPAKPDFSTWPDAATYRTAITKDVARGANFAGHYVVASWGCPAFGGCEGHAVVDVIDGSIIAYGLTSSGRAQYAKDSRLFVMTGKDGEERYVLNESAGTFAKCH